MDFTETQEENVDYLEVDAPVPGQNYCCMSFISPENVLVQKDQFIMKNLLNRCLIQMVMLKSNCLILIIHIPILYL